MSELSPQQADPQNAKSPEHVLLDEKGGQEDAKRQEDAVKKAEQEMKKVLIEKQSPALGNRAEFSAEVTSEILLSPLSNLAREWEARRKDMYERAKKGEQVTYADLMQSTSEIERQMQETAGIISAYVIEMANKSGGQLSEVALAEMRNSVNKSAVKIAQLAMKHKDAPQIVEALQFALGVKKVEKTKMFDSLSKIISEKSDLSPYVWTALSFMDEKSQIEFGEYYMKNVKPEPDARKFLETWNVQGTISVETMRKILENLKVDTKEFEQKAKEYARNWGAKKDFTAQAEILSRSSYGATNQATDMLTPTGILTFAAKAWAVGTIGLNLATSTFYGGTINNPVFIMESLAKNPWFIAGAGTLAAFKAKESAGSVGDALKSPAEREVEARKSAKKEFQLVVSSNIELEAFLKSEKTYEGSKKFYDYLRYVVKEKGNEETPFPEKEMTKKAFLTWLKSQLEKETAPEEKSKIEKTITALQEADISDTELFRLATPFDKFGIGGSSAEQNYNKAMEE